MTQLSFFEDGTSIKTGNRIRFNYSYSRYEAFDSCERKYYYSYYGSKKTKALNESLKNELIELSELGNRHLIVGEILHSVIAWFLKTAKKGDVKEINHVESFAIKRLNNVLDHTVLFKSKGLVKKTEYPIPLIKELVYDYYNYSELKKELEDTIKINLHNFFHSKKFEDMRNGALTSNSIIEEKCNFNLGNIKVTGKIDLAFEDDEFFTINDWKSGKSHFEETSLQLLIYALWARSKDELIDKNIIIQKSYLAEDEIDILKFSESQLSRAKAKIRQQVELLKEMEEFGNQAIESAFPLRKHEKKCKLCSFEKICYR
jgi:CRISPR/Cas system-associated exonuclease Cas4 (RecB family)